MFQELQGEVMTFWLPLGVSVLGLVVTIAIPVAGYVLHSINKRVDELKADTAAQIEAIKHETEAKRTETRDTILDLVEAKFDAIKDTLKDIKDELKDHFRAV